MSNKTWTYSKDGKFATCSECNETHEIGVIPDDFYNPKKDRCNSCDAKIVMEPHKQNKV